MSSRGRLRRGRQEDAVAQLLPAPPRPLPGRHTEQARLGRERLLHRELVRERAAEEGIPGPAPIEGPDADLSWWAVQRRRTANLGLGVAVALVVAIFTAIGSATGPIRFDDEGTYVSQATAVLHGALAPYTYWYDHPPLGWIVLAGWMGTFGRIFEGANPVATARIFMAVVTFISTVALVMLARRLGGSRPTAALAGLMFGFSPLALQYHRMVMLDNIAVMFLLIGWMLAATASKRLGAATMSGAFLACAVLTKETLLVTAPFMAWMAWRSYAGPTRRISIAAFMLMFLMLSSFYPLLAAVRGELLPGRDHVSLWDGVVFQLFTREGSGSIFNPASNAHTVFSNWVASDGFLLAFGLLFLIPAWLNHRVRPLAAAATLAGLMIIRGGYLPVPYVIVLLPLAAVVGALGLETVVRYLARPFEKGRYDSESTALSMRFPSIVAIALLTVGVGSFVPRMAGQWWGRDKVYLHHDFDLPTRSASAWLGKHTRSDQVVVADNVIWTDLVDGKDRPQRSTVWFTKLGADPSVDRSIRTWRDVDYVVVSDIVRTSDQAPTLRGAIAHSKVVKAWGAGSERVEIRKVSAK